MKVLFQSSLLLAVASAACAGTITIGSNGASVFFQENPQNSTALRSLGQTFVVPPPTADNVLTDFSFFFTTGTEASFDYRAYIFAWDSANTRAAGAALFSSAARAGNQAPSFTGLNLALTPGTTYVALLTTQGVVNNGFSNGLLFSNSSNPYAPGGAFSQTTAVHNGATGTGSWTAAAWTPVSGSDFQFTANFATGVPEPSTIALIGIGLAGISLFRRKR